MQWFRNELTMYYAHEQLQRWQFRGPDCFLVRDVARIPRNSWVVWEDGTRWTSGAGGGARNWDYIWE